MAMSVNLNIKEFTAVTTGTGATRETQGKSKIAMFNAFSAGVTAGVVVLEGSPDGTAFVTLASRGFAASTNFLDVGEPSNTDKSRVFTVRFIRVRVSTTIAGGTVSTWLIASGDSSDDAGWKETV